MINKYICTLICMLTLYPRTAETGVAPPLEHHEITMLVSARLTAREPNLDGLRAFITARHQPAPLTADESIYLQRVLRATFPADYDTPWHEKRVPSNNADTSWRAL